MRRRRFACAIGWEKRDPHPYPSTHPPTHTQAGVPLPTYPREPLILSSQINLNDPASYNIEYLHPLLLPFLGYRRRNSSTHALSPHLYNPLHFYSCATCCPDPASTPQHLIISVGRPSSPPTYPPTSTTPSDPCTVAPFTHHPPTHPPTQFPSQTEAMAHSAAVHGQYFPY